MQYRTLPAEAWWGALAVGLPACGILLANNVRDVADRRVAGKRTLAVRIGAARARLLYVACIVGALVAVVGAARSGTRPRCSRSLAAPLAIAPVRVDAHASRPAVTDRRARRHGPLPAGARRAARGRPVARLAVASCRRANVGDQAAEHRGLLERQRVTAVESHVHDAARAVVRASSARSPSNFASRVPVTSSDRHRQLAEPVPHRFHRARARARRRQRGEERGRERAAVGEPGRVGAARSRTAAARASARGTRRRRRCSTRLGQLLVGVDARGALAASSMPGGRAHQHERRARGRDGRARAAGQPAAHRVADVDRAPARVADRASRSRRTSSPIGHVDRDAPSHDSSHDSRSARRATTHAGLREAGDEHARPAARAVMSRTRAGAMSEPLDATHLVRDDARRRVGARRASPTRSSRPGRASRRSRSRWRATAASGSHVVLDERSAGVPRARSRPRDRPARGRVLHVGHRGGRTSTRR